MGIKSLGNKKSISYAGVWDETGTGAWLPESWYGGTGKWYGARAIVAGGRDGSNGGDLYYTYNILTTEATGGISWKRLLPPKMLINQQ